MFRCGQVDAIFGASVMIHSVQFYKNQPSLTTVIFITDFSDPLMLRPLEPDKISHQISYHHKPPYQLINCMTS